MTFLVLSDIHRRGDRAEELLSRPSTYDGVLFLGDGWREFPEDLCRGLGLAIYAVRGNCDGILFSEDLPEERLFTAEGFRVLMMHGHSHGVKHGAERAIAYAASKGADLLLYGHTHTPEERYLPAGTEIFGVTLQKPLWVMNPGSLGEPREGAPSFGTVELRREGLLLSRGSL